MFEDGVYAVCQEWSGAALITSIHTTKMAAKVEAKRLGEEIFKYMEEDFPGYYRSPEAPAWWTKIPVGQHLDPCGWDLDD